MNIDQDAPLTGRDTVVIDAPLEKVWSDLTAIERWPEWQSSVSSAEFDGPLAIGTRFEWKANGLKIVSTIEDVKAERRIAWSGKSIGMKAVHQWELEPENGGTQVVTEESLSGWLAWVLKVFDRSFLEKSLDTALQELKARAEEA
jgi:uncharacterized protein YndB with AHSA1/START domain